MAYRYADKQNGNYNEADELAQEKFAELAAAWGAEQAQQTTDPLGFQIRRAIAAEDELRATKQTLEHAYAALQKVADAQAAIEEPELPEAVGYMNAGHVHELTQRRISYGYVYPKKETGASVAVYTATQMHDHFAAGVLATLRKDAERYRWLAAKATQQADSIGPIFRIDVRRKNDGTPFSLGAAIDAATARWLMEEAAKQIEQQAAEIGRLKSEAELFARHTGLIIAGLTRNRQESDALLQQALEALEAAINSHADWFNSTDNAIAAIKTHLTPLSRNRLYGL